MVAILAGSLFVLLLGVVMERVIIRHFYHRPDEDQMLVTFGLGIIFVETRAPVFASQSQRCRRRRWAGHHQSRLHVLPTYRLGWSASSPSRSARCSSSSIGPGSA